LSTAERLVSEGCQVKACCTGLGVARSTFYRSRRGVAYGPPRPRPRPANRVGDEERRQIREALHEPRFIDRTPWEIVPTLLDEGTYLASIRTFYRVLDGDGELKERRLQATHPRHVAPVLEATGPNQVWSWDITHVKGPCKGQSYFLYVMVDLFSRYVVGWMLAERENARRAQHFIRETARLHLAQGQSLTVHNDRGSPMKAGTTRELINRLGLKHSFSRPRTSDDNPFSEAAFRTVKYSHRFPEFFDSLKEGEEYFSGWFSWYNNEHRHTGINLHTPASVFGGRVEKVARKRQEILDLAFSLNPERFPMGRPLAKRNPPVVGINLHPKAEEVGQLQKIKTEE